MLNEVQKRKFTQETKKVAQNILNELNITNLNNDSICDLQNELDLRVAALVSSQEDGKIIDENLLETYDLLVDIVLDNEEDLSFLNQLFFD